MIRKGYFEGFVSKLISAWSRGFPTEETVSGEGLTQESQEMKDN